MRGTIQAVPRRPARSGATTRLRWAVAIAALIAAVLLLAGCGGDSTGPRVAGAPGSGDPTTSTSTGAGKGDALAYAKCMRAHGITDFPDPNSSGGFGAQPGGDLDPRSPRFQSAAAACKSLAPQAPPDAGQARAANLKYSKCMRDHGIKDFPDPDSNGQINLDNKPGNSDLAPSNPQFQAAAKACKKLQNNGGQPPVGGDQGNGG